MPWRIYRRTGTALTTFSTCEARGGARGIEAHPRRTRERAAGAWIDKVNTAAAAPARRMIGGTRGSHLMLDLPALAETLHGRMIYFEAEGGRRSRVKTSRRGSTRWTRAAWTLSIERIERASSPSRARW